MKIIGYSCLIVSAFILVMIFSINHSANSSKGASVLFDDPTIFEYANKNYSVSAMGVSKDEKVLSIQISDSRQKENVRKYFEKHIQKAGMSNYAIEVQIEDDNY
ncbi:hypothetical protein [Lysinibacillus sp. 54212]|uniref:hypothetical protein n=1 Tax=Lysinibacillus sp. 54212 TaxID=3119829 RepID=UPI002FCBEC83